MKTGYVHLKGSGPCNSMVAIFDSDDQIIAECKSDSRGFWSVASVEMEVGQHQLLAKTRGDFGEEHSSSRITVVVHDPDCEVEIAAEQLEPEMVATMRELEAEEQQKEYRRQAAKAYLDLVETAVDGYHDVTGELQRVLSATGISEDEFWGEVTSGKLKKAYSRLVCTVAAGLTLEERDQRSIYGTFKKTEDEFGADVASTRRMAGSGWRTSLDEE